MKHPVYRTDRGIGGFDLRQRHKVLLYFASSTTPKHHAVTSTAETPEFTITHSNFHLRYFQNNDGTGESEQSDSLTHTWTHKLKRQDATRCRRQHAQRVLMNTNMWASHAARSSGHTWPNYNGCVVRYFYKSDSTEQMLRASCTHSRSRPRRFPYPTHRVNWITNSALMHAVLPQFPNSFIPVRSKNFLLYLIFKNKFMSFLQITTKNHILRLQKAKKIFAYVYIPWSSSFRT